MDLKELIEKAQSGDANALCELGKLYVSGSLGKHYYVKAVECWKEGVAKNHLESMVLLGHACLTGKGIGYKDFPRAHELFTKAAEKNYGPAYRGLAKLHSIKGVWERNVGPCCLYTNFLDSPYYDPNKVRLFEDRALKAES